MKKVLFYIIMKYSTIQLLHVFVKKCNLAFFAAISSKQATFPFKNPFLIGRHSVWLQNQMYKIN